MAHTRIWIPQKHSRISRDVATKRNITVAIEPALLNQARAVAARRGRSVSALLADELRELVAEDARYSAARRRATAPFSTPLPLEGTPLSREELHERPRIR
jgi:hypothetical protein